jgi:hypothetical protein
VDPRDFGESTNETVRLYIDSSRLLGRGIVWSAEVIASPEEQERHADQTALRKEVA